MDPKQSKSLPNGEMSAAAKVDEAGPRYVSVIGIFGLQWRVPVAPQLTVYIHAFNYHTELPPQLSIKTVQRLRLYKTDSARTNGRHYESTLRRRLLTRQYKDGTPIIENEVAVLVGGRNAHAMAAAVIDSLLGVPGIKPSSSTYVRVLVIGRVEMEWGGFWCPCERCERCRTGRFDGV